ncbi:hypothetical protein [Brucella sp. NBRC 12953]|uniref:hypothetical protein n=1 Tax=Brucella sp. NBRC 12953 TaxID=3075481 RepID=UPI000DE27652
MRKDDMIENGYKLRKDDDGTWSVIEAYKNEPAEFEGKLQTGLTEEKAHECLVQLTRKFMERQHEGGSGRLP